jgi:hypothetical protein
VRRAERFTATARGVATGEAELPTRHVERLARRAEPKLARRARRGLGRASRRAPPYTRDVTRADHAAEPESAAIGRVEPGKATVLYADVRHVALAKGAAADAALAT